ncbi:TIM barrel protein [uncultured Gimesia sp.]|uniref:sugar phosphate isomerase/epimerase family protein n=1 Tax=uncultured Gimesia sp. TaxID=1678688 RepID=UPI002611916E|nr:TIM barrel protein [uncultured Gimesia sp.]
MTFDRRSFIQYSGAALFAGVLPHFASASLLRQRQMKLDLSCGRIGVKADQKQAIDYAARYGFEAVVPEAGYLGQLSESQLADLKADMQSKNLVFSAAGMPVDFRNDESRFKEGIAALPASSAALQRAGVTRTGTWLMPTHDELTYNANFKQHVRRLKEISRILSDNGLRFGMEYVGPKTLWSSKKYPYIHSMPETKELIAEIDVNGVGLILDSWHWYTAHETKEDLLTLTNADIVAVDLNDAPAGLAIDEQLDQKRELPMATGVIDLALFLNTLNSLGYDGPVRAEPFNAALRKLPADQAVAATAAAMKKAIALVN